MKRKLIVFSAVAMVALAGLAFQMDTAQTSCPLEGTPDCPKIDCPLAGTPACPYEVKLGELPACCKKAMEGTH